MEQDSNDFRSQHDSLFLLLLSMQTGKIIKSTHLIASANNIMTVSVSYLTF